MKVRMQVGMTYPLSPPAPRVSPRQVPVKSRDKDARTSSKWRLITLVILPFLLLAASVISLAASQGFGIQQLRGFPATDLDPSHVHALSEEPLDTSDVGLADILQRSEGSQVTGEQPDTGPANEELPRGNATTFTVMPAKGTKAKLDKGITEIEKADQERFKALANLHAPDLTDALASTKGIGELEPKPSDLGSTDVLQPSRERQVGTQEGSITITAEELPTSGDATTAVTGVESQKALEDGVGLEQERKEPEQSQEYPNPEAPQGLDNLGAASTQVHADSEAISSDLSTTNILQLRSEGQTTQEDTSTEAANELPPGGDAVNVAGSEAERVNTAVNLESEPPSTDTKGWKTSQTTKSSGAEQQTDSGGNPSQVATEAEPKTTETGTIGAPQGVVQGQVMEANPAEANPLIHSEPSTTESTSNPENPDGSGATTASSDAGEVSDTVDTSSQVGGELEPKPVEEDREGHLAREGAATATATGEAMETTAGDEPVTSNGAEAEKPAAEGEPDPAVPKHRGQRKKGTWVMTPEDASQASSLIDPGSTQATTTTTGDGQEDKVAPSPAVTENKGVEPANGSSVDEGGEVVGSIWTEGSGVAVVHHKEKPPATDWTALAHNPLRVFMYDLPERLETDVQGGIGFNRTSGTYSNPTGGMNYKMHSVEYWMVADMLLPNEERFQPASAVRVMHPRDADIHFAPFLSTFFYNVQKEDTVDIESKFAEWLRGQALWQKRDGTDHLIIAHHPNALRHARSQLKAALFVLCDFGRFGSPTKDVIAPYHHVLPPYAMDLARGEPGEADNSDGSDRPTLLFFRGVIKRKKGGMVREELRKVLAKEPGVQYEDGTRGKGGTDIATQKMRASKFCLSPAGDTPSSCRLFDAIVSHCVPVIVSDMLAEPGNLPYDDVLDYHSFAVFIPTDKAVHPGYLAERLRRMYAKGVWKKKHEKLKEVDKHFMFNYPTEPGSAVSMVWDSIARMVKKRSKGLRKGL